MKKYQFILWPIFDSRSWWSLVYFTRFGGTGLTFVYAWSLQIGPVEVR